MKKTTFLNNYKSYAYTNAFKALKEQTSEIVEYVTSNNIIDKDNISISKDFVNNFNLAIESILKDGGKLVEKWQALSNNAKRKAIANAVLYCLKRDYFFDASQSTYNKEARSYTRKAYTLDTKLKLNDLFYQVAITLNGKALFID